MNVDSTQLMQYIAAASVVVVAVTSVFWFRARRQFLNAKRSAEEEKKDFWRN